MDRFLRAGQLRWRRGESASALDLDLPLGVNVEPQYADISDVIDRKTAGIKLYASQIERLFESEQGMLDDLAGYHARVALAGRRVRLRRTLLGHHQALSETGAPVRRLCAPTRCARRTMPLPCT